MLSFNSVWLKIFRFIDHFKSEQMMLLHMYVSDLPMGYQIIENRFRESMFLGNILMLAEENKEESYFLLLYFLNEFTELRLKGHLKQIQIREQMRSRNCIKPLGLSQ